MQPIAILGAGIAGLTAADELRRRGLPAIVFEAGPAIGGMASSFKDDDGYTYDVGAHFVSNRLARSLGTEDRCRTVARYGEAVRIGTHSYGYPLGLMRSPRLVRSALGARLKDRRVFSAADYFRNAFGDTLAREVAIPLVEAWSGASAEELSPSVGEKWQNGIAKQLYLKAAARVTGRAVCNGYTRTMPEGAGVWHVYPEGGISRLLEPMAQRVCDMIRLRSPIEKVIVEKGRVAAVRSGGETIPVSAAISTAPVNILSKLVEGTDALNRMAAFRYRPMVFVNLRFSGRHLLPDTMLWVPDRSQPFFRLTEAPRSMPWLAPEGKTLITFDIGCSVGDEYWSMSEEDLAKRCLDGICRIDPGFRDRYLGLSGVVRTPISYPVYLKSYDADRQAFSRSTGIEGLYSVGRNGEFAHILMEDVYWRTRSRMDEVAAYVGGAKVRPLAFRPEPVSGGMVPAE